MHPTVKPVALVAMRFSIAQSGARHPEFRDRSASEVFEAERARLVPYAGRFDGFHAVPASVSKTCLVRFDSNRYSVAASAVGRPVEVWAYADCIELRQDGRVVRVPKGIIRKYDRPIRKSGICDDHWRPCHTDCLRKNARATWQSLSVYEGPLKTYAIVVG